MLFSFFTVSSQNKDQTLAAPYQKQNEIKLNVFRLFSNTLEIIYERNLNKKSSWGGTFFIPYTQEQSDKDIDVNYFITSYYRRYFGKKYASGFFIEGFGILSSIDGKQITDINGNLTQKEKPNVIDFSLGLGLGSKWVTKSGFVFEGNIGLGRLLFNAKETDHDSVYRLGLSIGYRF